MCGMLGRGERERERERERETYTETERERAIAFTLSINVTLTAELKHLTSVIFLLHYIHLDVMNVTYGVYIESPVRLLF